MERKMEWKGNFGMEYGRCQTAEWNGMEDFRNRMKDNLPYFHTNSILDFAHGIYGQIYAGVALSATINQSTNHKQEILEAMA